MRILLTNDDGILAPGLLALHRAIAELGEVMVVAPETGQSAAGHSITLTAPLICNRVKIREGFEGTSVDGRPADCVKLALLKLIDPPPDLVISGMNAGANVGINLLYSGTVAAAVEGALFGVPSIAVSLEIDLQGESSRESKQDKKKTTAIGQSGDYLDSARGANARVDFDGAASIAKRLIEQIIAAGLRAGDLLNINIPQLGEKRPKGSKVVPMGTETVTDTYEQRTDPRGRNYYWIGADYDHPGGTNDDVSTLHDGFVTVTPLHFDLTRVTQLEHWRGVVSE